MSVVLRLRNPDLEGRQCLFNWLSIIQANGNVLDGCSEETIAFNSIIY